MDILGQSALLVAVISFALGFSVLSRNVRNKLFISFAVLATLISAWSLSFFMVKIWPDFGFYRLHLFLNVFLAPAGLGFIRVLVRIEDKTSRRLLEISLLQTVCLSVALLFRLESNPLILQLIYFSPVLIFIQTVQLMWADLRLKNRSKGLPKMPSVGLGRRNLIYLGAFVVLATSVMDHIPWMGKALPSFGNLALSVYLFFLSQAITQQKLLNISALFSRFLVLLAVALTLTLLYSVLVAWIQNSPGLFFLNSFIASFLILMLLDPLRSLVGYFTQRLLTQKHRRLQKVLRAADRELTGIVDLGTLSQAVLSTADKTLQPEWATLFVLTSAGRKFRRVRMSGESQTSAGSEVKPALRELLAAHPMIQYCENLSRKGKFPILLDQLLENEIDRSASRVQREEYSRLNQGLKALGSNMVIPLMGSGKMLGFIALRVPSPPEPWGNNWGLLPIIYPYFEHAAQTMQSMEVFARQREKDRLAALGEMAAGLAHEIRNPLGAIKGAAQFLDPTSDRPESRFLSVIIEEVDRLNRVVTEFLEYSKPPTFEFGPVDLSKLAERTVELMRPGIRTEVEFEFQPSRYPVFVLASGEQIRQVLINLIHNSHNALAEKAQGTIRVSVGMEGEIANTEVTLAVEDNGHGIKREHLDKVFIPFFTTTPSGTGLGLSICHKIIEAHRGRIEVQSEEERFTRVSVILPLVKE